MNKSLEKTIAAIGETFCSSSQSTDAYGEFGAFGEMQMDQFPARFMKFVDTHFPAQKATELYIVLAILGTSIGTSFLSGSIQLVPFSDLNSSGSLLLIPEREKIFQSWQTSIFYQLRILHRALFSLSVIMIYGDEHLHLKSPPFNPYW
jgi:hypothetical protein